MRIHKHKFSTIVGMLILTVIGCDQGKDNRLSEMAEKHLDRQAEQNRRMTELQREVAEGSRHLVEADSKAREEMVALQRELQAERSEIGRQRDAIEDERRRLAKTRRLDPIIATAITNIGLLAACLLPLVLCWYLLHCRIDSTDDQAVTDLLLGDIVTDRPLLLTRIEELQATGDRGRRATRALAEDAALSREPD